MRVRVQVARRWGGVRHLSSRGHKVWPRDLTRVRPEFPPFGHHVLTGLGHDDTKCVIGISPESDPSYPRSDIMS